MGKTIVGSVEDFYKGETKRISVLCKIDSIAQNITADTVTLTLKENKSDLDTAAILQEDADVSTYGGIGIAYWALTPTQTDLDVGTYYIDIAWYDGSNEYIVYDGTVKVLERVSDV